LHFVSSKKRIRNSNIKKVND